MSDQATGERSPDQYVKRAPTASQALQQGVAVGTSGSTLGLMALYIQECLTAHRLVAPSTEMILVLLGLCFPAATVIWQVFNAKIRRWAAEEGVNGGQPT